MAPPYAYHRTVSESDAFYESIMIKFTPDFFCTVFRGLWVENVLDELYDRRVSPFFGRMAGKKDKTSF